MFGEERGKKIFGQPQFDHGKDDLGVN